MDENRTYEITRSVSKNGDMGLVSEDTMKWAQALPSVDKAVLYGIVRDESSRLESEWRPEFVQRVGVLESELPEATTESAMISDFLMWASEHADRGEVMDTFEEMLEATLPEDVEPIRKIIAETSQLDLLPILADYENQKDA